MPELVSNKVEKYCDKLRTTLWDELSCFDAIQRSCQLLDDIVGGDYERDKAKDSSIQTQARMMVKAEQGDPADV